MKSDWMEGTAGKAEGARALALHLKTQDDMTLFRKAAIMVRRDQLKNLFNEE